MNEFKTLSNKQLSQLFYRSRIAMQSLPKSMPNNDKQYIIKRHKDLSSEILRRGAGFLI